MQRVATQNDKQGKHAGKSLQVLFCDGVLFGPSFPPPLRPFSRGFFSEGSKTLDFRVRRNIKSPHSNPMEADPWSARFSSKRHQSALHSRSDLHLGFEETDGEDDSRAEFACPFCSEDFDIVGLCCHIDNVHPVEARNGVCPVCAARVGMNMVGHITMQHSHFFKVQRRRSHKGSGGCHSKLFLLRKELREGHIQSLLGGSSYLLAASNTAPDPLLTSFIYSLPVADASKSIQPRASGEGNSVTEGLDETVRESVEPSMLDGEQKEKAQKCEFIQQLLMSTFLDDIS